MRFEFVEVTEIIIIIIICACLGAFFEIIKIVTESVSAVFINIIVVIIVIVVVSNVNLFEIKFVCRVVSDSESGVRRASSRVAEPTYLAHLFQLPYDQA